MLTFLLLLFSLLPMASTFSCQASPDKMYVDCSYYALKTFKMDEAGAGPYIKLLNLSHNEISTVKADFFASFENLETLDLSWNPIRKIEALSFSHLDDLLLDVHYSGDKEAFRFSDWKVPNVRTFTLRLFDFPTIPTDILSKFENLRNFSLHFYSSSSTPMVVSRSLFNFSHTYYKLTNLFLGGDLEVSENSLKDAFRDLRMISLNVSKLHPKALNQFTELRNFKFVGRCSIEHLTADYLASFSSIKQLNLSSCGIKSIDRRAFKKMKMLNVLDLSHNQLRELPSKVFPTSIETLLLNSNQLEELPEELCQMSCNGLKRVDLSRNQLKLDRRKFFPISKEINTTSGMVSLNLSFNQISVIPPNFLKPLIYLEYLDASFNRLVGLHQTLFNFDFDDKQNKDAHLDLKKANFSNNMLNSLPTTWVAELEKLQLENNSFKCGPWLENYIKQKSQEEKKALYKKLGIDCTKLEKNMINFDTSETRITESQSITNSASTTSSLFLTSIIAIATTQSSIIRYDTPTSPGLSVFATTAPTLRPIDCMFAKRLEVYGRESEEGYVASNDAEKKRVFYVELKRRQWNARHDGSDFVFTVSLEQVNKCGINVTEFKALENSTYLWDALKLTEKNEDKYALRGCECRDFREAYLMGKVEIGESPHDGGFFGDKLAQPFVITLLIIAIFILLLIVILIIKAVYHRLTTHVYRVDQDKAFLGDFV